MSNMELGYTNLKKARQCSARKMFNFTCWYIPIIRFYYMYPRFRSANGSNDSFNENPNMPITPITPVGFVKNMKNNNGSIFHANWSSWAVDESKKMTSGLLTPCRGFYFHTSSGISDTSPGQILISPDVDELDLLGRCFHRYSQPLKLYQLYLWHQPLKECIEIIDDEEADGRNDTCAPDGYI